MSQKKAYLRVIPETETGSQGNDIPIAKTMEVTALLLQAFMMLDNREIRATYKSDSKKKLKYLKTLMDEPVELWNQLVEKANIGMAGFGEANDSIPVSYNPPTWDRGSPNTKGFLHLQVTNGTDTYFVYGKKQKKKSTEIYGLKVWAEFK